MLTDDHLDREQLERLLRLECTPHEALEWLFHLLRCQPCRARFETQLPGGRELLHKIFQRVGRDQLPRERSADADRCRTLLDHLQSQGAKILDEREEAPRLLAELVAHPPARRRLLLVNGKRFRSLGLAFAVLEKVRHLWQEKPHDADRWAEDCLQLVRVLSPDRYDSHLLEDARGLAWAYWGNGRRILGDAAKAGRAFRHALEHFRRGSDDPSDRADLLSFQASLREMQGRTPQALELLDRAQSLYHGLADQRGELRITIQRAHVLEAAGQVDQAVAILQDLSLEPVGDAASSAVSPVDPWAQSGLAELYGIARQNLAVLLVDTGHYDRARRLLPEVRRSGRDIGRMHRLRIAWLEGKICAGGGETQRAKRLLTTVRRAFIDEGLGLDTALVTLDLAALYLQNGWRCEARALATEMLPLFLAQDIQREACAALLLFHRALRDDTASAVLAREIGTHLRRLQYCEGPVSPPN